MDTDSRWPLKLLAAFMTLTAMGMAAVAAWDRGGTAVDRALLVAMAVTICAGTHLLPAISRRRIAWLIWSACLLGTIYGHLTFFTHTALRAGTVRAQQAAPVTDITRQIDATQAALAGISARPVATVARDLAYTKSERRRAVLQEELTEAKRAARLRDEMVGVTGAATSTRAAETSDPVMARLAVVTGSNEGSIALAVGIGFAILLELTGAFLWCEVFRRRDEPATEREGCPEQEISAEGDPLDDLRKAIDAGLCKPTVSSIRVFLGCGQARAMEMRRALAA